MKALPLAALLLAGTAGCNPSFSPPIRTAHYGAAGRIQARELEIVGGGNTYGSGGPSLGYALNDSLALEGGADLRQVDAEKWAMGYAGARLTYSARERDADGALAGGPAVDGAAGAGIGVGGSERPSSDHLAGGGYLEVGAAYYAPEVIAGFVRARIQGTKAQALPQTFWWSTVAGVEFWYGPFAVYAATGFAGYENAEDRARGWIPFEGGMSLHFDTSPQARGIPGAGQSTTAAR